MISAMHDQSNWGTDVERLDTTPPYLAYVNRWRTVCGFLEDAVRWGEREFLVEGDRRLTFDQFLGCVDAVKWQLREAHGVRSGDHVLLLSGNSADWIVAFFAVLASGATVVSGNAWWSGKELDHALSVATPVLVIADDRRAQMIPDEYPVMRIPLNLTATRCGSSLVEEGPFEEDLPAVVVFTSGTTGAPKAAELSHRSVIANQQNFLVVKKRLPSDLPADHQGAITLITVPLFHMGGIQSIFGALLTGGKLVIHIGRFDAATILRLIETERVHSWGAVPTMINRVIDHPDITARNTSSLRSVTVSGTRVTPQMIEQVRAAFPSTVRSAGTIYGMTEAGGTLTVATGRDMHSRPGTVGRPLPVVELKIKDPDDSGKGEIIARSPTNMTGYLASPEPSVIDTAGWLHTGDIGRIDDEGYLFIEGRIKDVIIRGGENIAAANVEAAIREHPAVADVAVIGMPDEEFGETVAAVVVPREGRTIVPAELKAFVSETLAYFEVPSRWWMRCEELPTNATGKVVKQLLRDAWPTNEEWDVKS
ncbi:putative long-chain-fatty-acid CoA ligase [Mycobacterium marseillense]|uniref:Long-chain-fatty-acid CoA ligase n=2 Tax=Mycobacterium marseillense TaxID=701042 RepID=A0ABM7JF54_9MYCO|nr:putative long-chain-fatty-acid CoA ligase [Mycobacterium marseillense]